MGCSAQGSLAMNTSLFFVIRRRVFTPLYGRAFTQRETLLIISLLLVIISQPLCGMIVAIIENRTENHLFRERYAVAATMNLTRIIDPKWSC